MAHTPSHDHGSSATATAQAGQTIFSPTEVDALYADDRAATTAIVVLISGIFTLGLMGYLVVAYWVTH